MKYCHSCESEKPFELFHKDSRNKDGLYSRCKKCRQEEYKEDREEILKYKKEFRKNNKKKVNEQQRELYRKSLL